jgi:hypothetical protein
LDGAVQRAGTGVSLISVVRIISEVSVVLSLFLKDENQFILFFCTLRSMGDDKIETPTTVKTEFGSLPFGDAAVSPTCLTSHPDSVLFREVA